MPETKRVTRSRESTLDRYAFYQPQKLLLFSILAFVLAIFVARGFAAIQRAGLVTQGPNVIGSFHFHHWAFSCLVLPVLLIMAFWQRHNKVVWGILMIGIAFFLGLFIDGIVYLDSAIFFEPLEPDPDLQPVTIADLYFLGFLGATLLILTFFLVYLHAREIRIIERKRR